MLEDMDFIKSCDVPGPTKEAIIAIILYKSEVSHTDKVVDCGCGTGGITCEFSQRAEEVISIDTNPEAIEITKKNLEKFGLGDNVTLINDNGANALKDIDNIDIAIVGGSGRELENILDIIHSKLNSKVHRGFPAPPPLSPFSPPDLTGGSTPLLCLEGVPDLPVAPQDEAGLTKTFQTWPRGWFHIP